MKILLEVLLIVGVWALPWVLLFGWFIARHAYLLWPLLTLGF